MLGCLEGGRGLVQRSVAMSSKNTVRPSPRPRLQTVRRLLAGRRLAALLAAVIAACGGGSEPIDPRSIGSVAGDFTLTSSAFETGGRIPARHTCDGEDRSPPLSWSNPPEGTDSYVLIVDDPDAPGGNFVHWILTDIPGDTSGLNEGLPKAGSILSGQLQPRNDFGNAGYDGPCPPPGAPHGYRFFLYALDGPSGITPQASKSKVVTSIEGHVLARAELSGTYGR